MTQSRSKARTQHKNYDAIMTETTNSHDIAPLMQSLTLNNPLMESLEAKDSNKNGNNAQFFENKSQNARIWMALRCNDSDLKNKEIRKQMIAKLSEKDFKTPESNSIYFLIEIVHYGVLDSDKNDQNNPMIHSETQYMQERDRNNKVKWYGITFGEIVWLKVPFKCGIHSSRQHQGVVPLCQEDLLRILTDPNILDRDLDPDSLKRIVTYSTNRTPFQCIIQRVKKREIMLKHSELLEVSTQVKCKDTLSCSDFCVQILLYLYFLYIESRPCI